MKATGIVRRIDDLGRVVIPKEIRRTMRIREGDPLEIYTDVGGEVIFKKYSPIGELTEMAILFTEVLYKSSGVPAVITDRDHIIAASGISKKDLIDRKISKELEEMLEKRQTFSHEKDKKQLNLIDSPEKKVLFMAPIISAGDLLGSVLFIEGESGETGGETELKLSSAAALFLAKQMEA